MFPLLRNASDSLLHRRRANPQDTSPLIPEENEFVTAPPLTASPPIAGPSRVASPLYSGRSSVVSPTGFGPPTADSLPFGSTFASPTASGRESVVPFEASPDSGIASSLSFSSELVPVRQSAAASPAVLDELLTSAGVAWQKDITRKFYKGFLNKTLSQFDVQNLEGIKFLEDLAVAAMRRTLISISSPNDNNLFLMRLLFLAMHSKNSVYSRRYEMHAWQRFPLHPAMLFTHGKRVQINTQNLSGLCNWLKRGISDQIKLRLSSHALRRSRESESAISQAGAGSVLEEKIGLKYAWEPNYGLNIGVFGIGQVSPYTNEIIKANGNCGHICIVKKTAPRMPSRSTSASQLPTPPHKASRGGSLLVGVENSAPLKDDQTGASHGVDCTPKEWSAFFLPKWDSEYFDPYRQAGGLALPIDKTNCMKIECGFSDADFRELMKFPDHQMKEFLMQHLV